MTVLAHQKEVAELRKILQQNLLEAENWPKKVTNTYSGWQYISQDFFTVSEILNLLTLPTVLIGELVMFAGGGGSCR